MHEDDLNLVALVDLIQAAGRPVHINTLTRQAVQTWLEARAQERHYAPGACYAPGETIRFRGHRAAVTSVEQTHNPVQGKFSIVTLALPDGTECWMAAEIAGAPSDDQQPVTDDLVEEILRKQGVESRNTVRALLAADPRLVSCETMQGEFWCLGEMVPCVTEDELRSAEVALPEPLHDGEPVSRTTEELAKAVWGLEDDGSHEFALYAFALRRALGQLEGVVNLGDRWASGQAWKRFTERPTLEVPRVSSQVTIPEGIPPASATDIDREQRQEEVEEAGEGAAEEPDEDLGDWRGDRPTHAIFTLRARHYHEGWLPLSQGIRRLFPPLSSDQQAVTFHQHFGDEPDSFNAFVDREGEGCIWVSPDMYETFRNHGIYPGARLRISARNEQEFDLATRPTDKTEPVRVWRMWLNEDGRIEYEDFEEPRRYDIADDVYVADVRFEDREALFRQAEERGAGISQLMYEKAVEWWEENDRRSLVVTADELFDAIHFHEQGRMTCKATVAWELWKRLAFEALGGGRYLFRPQFGAEVPSAGPRRRVEPTETVPAREPRAYFIFQQRPDSEYADRAGEVYNWRQGIPGSRQIVEGARFIYYRPGKQIFFGTGRVGSIESYIGDDGETYYNGHVADYEPWEPPLPLTPELAEKISFIHSERLGVGQAGIRRIERDDFMTILRAYGRGREARRGPKLATGERQELWSRVAELEGRTLHTLDQGRPFRVTRLSEKALAIELKGGTPSSLGREKLEGAYAQLIAEGEIPRSAIEAFLRFNSAYAAAVLASLPDVEHRTRPIRLFYRPKKASSRTAAVKAAPPIDEEVPSRVAKERVKEMLQSWRPLRWIKAVRSQSLFWVGDSLVWLRYSKLHKAQGHYWLGIPKNHFEKIKGLAKPIYVLLICGHPERTLVVPFAFLESIGITSAPVNKNGEWILYVYRSADRFEIALWTASGERERFDVTRYLNNYEPVLKSSAEGEEKAPKDDLASARPRVDVTRKGSVQAWELVPPGPLFEESPARARARERGEEPESRPDGPRDRDVKSRIDAEFRQIREIIEEQLVGETVPTLVQAKPNDIVGYDNEGLTVVTGSGESQVRWEWIKDVYKALYRLQEIESRDVQEGEFQTPGGYRSAFIFALLARFSHIEARTKPRRTLIYHEPEGPILLRDTGDDEDVAGGPPGPSPPSGSGPPPGAPPRRPSRSPELVSSSGKPDDMQTKTLFSQHYLQNRLPDHAEWQDDPRPLFDAVRDLWQRAREYGDTWNESQTEHEFVQPMLELLGWTYIVQPKAHHAGRVRRPDYALFPDEATKDDAMPHQGEDAAFYSRAPTIAEVKYWGRPLSQKDPSGREKWDAQSNPSHQMVSYLVGTRVGWGILTNGRTWRLYSREVSSTASEYYESDLGLIFDLLPDDGEPSAEQGAVLMDRFRRWWLFFRQRSFVPDAEGRSFVERVQEGSDTYARRISDTLKKLVYEKVMPQIAGGFVAYRHHQKRVEEEAEDSLRQIYRASLSLLYKLLFLLYGEARALLPVSNPGYREQSLTKMAQWAAERLDRDLPLSDATHATSRYDALLALFHRVDRGDPSLGIPRYDGGLFDPSSPESQFLEGHKLSDRAVAVAVDTLVRDAGEPVDYAYIGVQNLGSIYEGLLENRLRVVDAAAGQVELIGDQGERKATGSYYTPDYIVEYLVRHTLDPILEERDEAFRGAMDRCAELRGKLRKVSRATTIRHLRGDLDQAEREAREAFLGIKVLDPAMGSGHFLVNAVDHLTDAIIRRMQVYHDEHPKVPWEWNPIQRLIEQLRGAILAEMERQGIQVDPARLDDTALLTRLVMKRCIYGVDLNRMAVELAKVSLWLHTFTVGAPLSFLDHHLRWGNSLIGTDVRTVEEQIRTTGAGQLSLWQGPFAGLLDLTGLMVEVVERADATLADVQRSTEDFERFQKELTPYKQVLDLWVSQHFGNEDAYEFVTLYGDDVLPAVKGELEVAEQYRAAIEQARGLYEGKCFFHWDLEFPEVFIDLRKRDWAENPGFDAVIGNPPWVNLFGMSSSDRQYFREAFRSPYGKYDIYVVFVEASLALSKRMFGMIIPNRFLRSKYGKALRDHMLALEAQWRLTEFSSNDVFEDATTYPCIVVGELSTGSHLVEVAKVETTWPTLDDLSDAKPARLTSGDFSMGVIHRAKVIDAIPMESDITFPLGEIVDQIGQGVYTGAKDIFVVEDPSGIEPEMWRPVVDGADLNRFASPRPNKYLVYPYRVSDGEIELLELKHYPKASEYLSDFEPRLLGRKFWGETIASAGKHFYEIWNPSPFMFSQKILYAEIASGPTFTVDLKGDLACLKTCYCIVLRGKQWYSLYYLLSLLNSSLLFYSLSQRAPTMRGGKHYRFLTQYVEQLPIRRIHFTTPQAERQRLTAVGTAEAAEWIESAGNGSGSASFSAFSDSKLGGWLDERLSPIHIPDPELVRQHNSDPLNQDWQLPEEGPVEQSDVVHDLLAHLAEQMTEMHKERQSRVEPFWLDLEGVTTANVYEALHDHGKWESSLWKADPCRDFVDEESRSTVHLDESLAWNEPCFKAFVKMLAGSISNLSDVVAVYRQHHPDYCQLMCRIVATDRLIDLIVYRLYGLTEEEVAVVEGESP